MTRISEWLIRHIVEFFLYSETAKTKKLHSNFLIKIFYHSSVIVCGTGELHNRNEECPGSLKNHFFWVSLEI